MKILKYIIIGLIQGITEPLPISSSAHMIFINHYFKIDDLNLSFEVIINFASTLAIFIFFFKDIKILLKNTITKANGSYNNKYIIKLLIASIPTVIVGLIFHDIIDKYFMNIFSSSICLIITGIFLLLCCIYIKNAKKSNITYSNALFIGLFQSIALIPGLSRSGLTLTAGLSKNITIKETLHFSFFLYLIASIGALFLQIIKLDKFDFNFTYTLISFISAFLGTTISINIFYNKLNKKLLFIFMFYCIIYGCTNLVILFL